MGEVAVTASAPQITTAGLRRALIAGARRVIERREELNRINVFPVPDGDTGSNLAFTMHSVLGEALARPARSVGELLGRVAAAAVDGARGNSGAILAQFLCGVGELATVDAPATTPGVLARAVQRGAEQAREALSQPREGTILSVIAAFSDALQHPVGDLRRWFEAGLARARAALAETPNQLEVLRQAGVVDAGAQGFVDLLEGIGEFLASGRLPRAAVRSETLPAALPEHGEADVDPLRRWCTECIVEGGDLARERLRDAVEALGADSVVIAGGSARVRIHAHVGDPAALFEAAAPFGRVSQRKADDMLAQQRATECRDRVAVVTDSGADLPQELIERLALNVVPVRVNFGDEDFLDKVTLSPAAFYRRLRQEKTLPRTSQPPAGDFRRQFEFLASHHPGVVYVGLSRAVSGTLQAAEGAARRVPGRRVGVVDSGHASCGQGLIALAVAEAARAGASADALEALAGKLRATTHTFALARDIDHAVRGGRIPAWAGPLAHWLPVTPVARMREGRVVVSGLLPGRRDLPRRFARWVLRRLPAAGRWRILVGHCDCADDGAELLAALRELLPCEDGWLVETGPAIGAHAGPGALVAALQQR